MEFKSIIFESELEFRNYVEQNRKDISKIIVFEDILENNIYFYGFIQESLMVAAVEHAMDKFDFYEKVYQSLIEELNFYIIPIKSQSKVLKLVKHFNET